MAMPNTSNRATFQAQAWYLKRLELYSREKPYMFAFDVSSRGVNNTNHEYEERLVSMADMRGRESQFLLDIHGFEIQHLPTALQNQDFDNGEIVRSTYYPEIESLMRTKFPSAYKIHIFSHLGGKLARQVTLLIADRDVGGLDFSPHGASQRLAALVQEDEALQKCRLEIMK
ncbi:unnamed protein product [Clonostachys solani]|uniref:Uncharacterized protein n=1 Tax=Clonostachys solani TaxID=160281 RepID=A0A9P0EMN2_9HYPO|nr:unnamed protein product [Clonostachys solani]